MKHLAWLRSGLFWRTFFLLAFLIGVSMAAWIASFQMVERGPRAQQIAAQMISIVTLTRAALTHSAPDLRRELLFDLASNEGIRIYPLEVSDKVEPTPDSVWMDLIQTAVRDTLGTNTRFASRVNDVGGFWISFNIEDDDYWLMFDRERVRITSGAQWVSWASLVMVLSLVGAVFISRLINLPLARLTAATRKIARGQSPDPLPEKGPAEIRETNRSFNQMVADLHRIDSDRAVILAGISHDLRTPITRMQLEVEMADLNAEARAGVQSDLAQMDAIIGQFLDYAKPADASQFTAVDVSALLTEYGNNAARHKNLSVKMNITPGLQIRGSAVDLQRLVSNLVENARRYGKTPGRDSTEIDIICRAEHGTVIVIIADHGQGVPDADTEQLLKPFVRMDSARSQANGAGLGLAIVDRIVRRPNGKLQLGPTQRHGLQVTISLPQAIEQRSRSRSTS